MTLEQMVEEFQCPGCVCGSNVKCGTFEVDPEKTVCTSHVLGTTIMGPGTFIKLALGLPKGFNRPGWNGTEGPPNTMLIRLYPQGMNHPGWDRTNVAVWAMVKDGFLYVRTVCPRVGKIYVDVIEGGTEIPKGAIDVGQFYEEID